MHVHSETVSLSCPLSHRDIAYELASANVSTAQLTAKLAKGRGLRHKARHIDAVQLLVLPHREFEEWEVAAATLHGDTLGASLCELASEGSAIALQPLSFQPLELDTQLTLNRTQATAASSPNTEVEHGLQWAATKS